MARDMVIAHRDVAAQYWHRPFREVLDAAKGGALGLRAVVQEPLKGGAGWPIDTAAYRA